MKASQTGTNGHYVDLLRPAKAPATPPRVFVIVLLLYHISAGKSRQTLRGSAFISVSSSDCCVWQSTSEGKLCILAYPATTAK